MLKQNNKVILYVFFLIIFNICEIQAWGTCRANGLDAGSMTSTADVNGNCITVVEAEYFYEYPGAYSPLQQEVVVNANNKQFAGDATYPTSVGKKYTVPVSTGIGLFSAVLKVVVGSNYPNISCSTFTINCVVKPTSVISVQTEETTKIISDLQNNRCQFLININVEVPIGSTSPPTSNALTVSGSNFFSTTPATPTGGGTAYVFPVNVVTNLGPINDIVVNFNGSPVAGSGYSVSTPNLLCIKPPLQFSSISVDESEKNDTTKPIACSFAYHILISRPAGADIPLPSNFSIQTNNSKLSFSAFEVSTSPVDPNNSLLVNFNLSTGAGVFNDSFSILLYDEPFIGDTTDNVIPSITCKDISPPETNPPTSESMSSSKDSPSSSNSKFIINITLLITIVLSTILL